MALRDGVMSRSDRRQGERMTEMAGMGPRALLRQHPEGAVGLASRAASPGTLRALLLAPTASGHALAAMLHEGGLATVVAESGRASLRELYLHRPDVVLLDLDSSTPADWEYCRTLQVLLDLPLVALGDAAREQDKVRALRLGADGYLAKPVAAGDLLAHIQLLCRRAGLPAITDEPVYADGRVRLDFRRYEGTAGGRVLALRPTEFRLLAYLVQNRGRVVTPDQILERVWGDESESFGSVKQYISSLRRKLGDTAAALIVTVRGVGYRYDPPQS